MSTVYDRPTEPSLTVGQAFAGRSILAETNAAKTDAITSFLAGDSVRHEVATEKWGAALQKVIEMPALGASVALQVASIARDDFTWATQYNPRYEPSLSDTSAPFIQKIAGMEAVAKPIVAQQNLEQAFVSQEQGSAGMAPESKTTIESKPLAEILQMVPRAVLASQGIAYTGTDG